LLSPASLEHGHSPGRISAVFAAASWVLARDRGFRRAGDTRDSAAKSAKQQPHALSTSLAFRGLQWVDLLRGANQQLIQPLNRSRPMPRAIQTPASWGSFRLPLRRRDLLDPA
jgi:hypothetical protein